MGEEREKRAMHEQNRRSWNAVTPVHNAHKRDQPAFLRRGGTTLWPDELELLGDLAGLSVVHLQCNCGQDTLCLSRIAGSVVGVDIADAAVDFARELSRATGLRATFVRSDLFDWFDSTPERYDVAFSSYGTIGWLYDVTRWARGVARVLKPGGRLVLLEFHPLVWSLGARGLTGDSYFVEGAIRENNGVNDYVGDALAPSGYEAGDGGFRNPEPAYGFQWTVAEIVQGIVDAGFLIEIFREYPYANGCELFDGMRRIERNRYVMPEGLPSVPLMLGISARSPAAAQRLGQHVPRKNSSGPRTL
ncbi:MAG TPA: class I SAM-dependent methyltransferase [Candidatus Polarisedimenticolaceae bacterium]|nr:class I SAM-dependent methyltransferase [Candidatus Polarisedimenticolaceae bacterium]